MSFGPKQRLDMKHGFVKSIIRNQVDRDNYDREVRAKQADKPKTKHRSRKPDVPTYMPPFSRQKREGRDELFCLEFEDKDGQVYASIIYKDDNPGIVARKIGEERDLSVPYTQALTQRLTEEFEKRLKRDDSGES